MSAGGCVFCCNAKWVCLGKWGSQPLSFFRWRGKYTCQRNEPRLWINELTEGRQYLFSSHSLYATPGCQNHCKISNNITRLFAFKSLFLTLCKPLSRAEVSSFSRELRSAVCSQSCPVLLPLRHWVLFTSPEPIYESPVLVGFVWSWVCGFLRSSSQNYITNEFTVGSKREHVLRSNVFTIQRCSRKAVFPKWLFSGIFTTVYIRILLPWTGSEEFSYRLGNCVDMEMEFQVCSSSSSLTPSPELCPGLCKTPAFEQILISCWNSVNLVLNGGWKEWHSSNGSQKWQAKAMSNVPSTVSKIAKQEQQRRCEKIISAPILDVAGDCYSPYRKLPQLQGFPN